MTSKTFSRHGDQILREMGFWSRWWSGSTLRLPPLTPTLKLQLGYRTAIIESRLTLGERFWLWRFSLRSQWSHPTPASAAQGSSAGKRSPQKFWLQKPAEVVSESEDYWKPLKGFMPSLTH